MYIPTHRPELLHQYLLGIMKYVFLWTVQDISAAKGVYGGLGGGIRKLELDQRLASTDGMASSRLLVYLEGCGSRKILIFQANIGCF
jgi:hypothetical protein